MDVAKHTAQAVLHLGDSILERHGSGQTYAQAAQALGVTPDQAKKAARLARAFGPEQRHQIGEHALHHLTAAHLEAAARHPDADVRVDLTLGAHTANISARCLQATINLLLEKEDKADTSCRSEYSANPDFDAAAKAAEALVHRGTRGLASYVAGQQGKGLVRLCTAMKELIPMVDRLRVKSN